MNIKYFLLLVFTAFTWGLFLCFAYLLCGCQDKVGHKIIYMHGDRLNATDRAELQRLINSLEDD
jgi:hypothetical protein